MTIVVTGGIGSGKSAVCDILEKEYGFPVYKADDEVKKLYDRIPSLTEEIEERLGIPLRDGKGRFIPSVLAQRIFDDRDALLTVESLVFPALMQDFGMWKKSHDDSSHVIFESATILEKPQFDGFGDLVLLVDAPVPVRLERAVSRDGVGEDIVRRRIDNQKLMNLLSEGGEYDRIDHVLINAGSLEELGEKVAEFVEKYNLT